MHAFIASNGLMYQIIRMAYFFQPTQGNCDTTSYGAKQSGCVSGLQKRNINVPTMCRYFYVIQFVYGVRNIIQTFQTSLTEKTHFFVPKDILK